MWSTSAILTPFLSWLAIGSVHETSPSSLFIACSSSTGQHLCATDLPDRVESSILNPASGQCIPDDAVCGWKCRRDPRCVEFDVWSSNRTCELYYSPPTAYLLTPGCVHFQVNEREILSESSIILFSCHRNILDTSQIVRMVSPWRQLQYPIGVYGGEGRIKWVYSWLMNGSLNLSLFLSWSTHILWE